MDTWVEVGRRIYMVSILHVYAAKINTVKRQVVKKVGNLHLWLWFVWLFVWSPRHEWAAVPVCWVWQWCWCRPGDADCLLEYYHLQWCQSISWLYTNLHSCTGRHTSRIFHIQALITLRWEPMLHVPVQPNSVTDCVNYISKRTKSTTNTCKPLPQWDSQCMLLIFLSFLTQIFQKWGTLLSPSESVPMETPDSISTQHIIPFCLMPVINIAFIVVAVPFFRLLHLTCSILLYILLDILLMIKGKQVLVVYTHIIMWQWHCVNWNRLPKDSGVPNVSLCWWIQPSKSCLSTHKRLITVSALNINLKEERNFIYLFI